MAEKSEKLKSAKERLVEIREKLVELIQERRAVQAKYQSGEMTADAASKRIEEIESEVESLEAETPQLMATAQVEEVIELVQRYLPIGKMVLKKIEPELLDVMKLLSGVMIDLTVSMEPEADKFAEISARALARKYKSLKATKEFTDEEAFQLTLASVKPVDFATLMKQASTSSSSAVSTRRKS